MELRAGRTWWIALVSLLSACGPMIIAQQEERTALKRFELDFDCSRGEIKRAVGSTYRVAGCGKSAQYTCNYDTCAREYTDRDLRSLTRAQPAAPRAYNAGNTQAYGQVQRTYDEQQAMHFVRAKLWLGKADELYLAGAPKQALTTVHMQAVIRGVRPQDAMYCRALRVRINDRPFDAVDVKFENQTVGRLARVTGKFEFEIFRPLSQPYAKMSVESCGRSFEMVAEHMPKLVEFFEIFSQIATEVQNEGGGNTAPVSDPGAISL